MSLGTVWLDSKSLGRAALLASLVLTGCPGPSATLEIVSPENGAVLGVTTDTNPALAGVQTDIIVEATGIAVGDNVELIVDDVIVTSQLTPEDGQFTFEDITLSPGEHVIRASRAGTVESAPITVTVTSDECFAISFVTPNPSGSRVTLGEADDVDGDACGAGFETDVVVSTDAGNGAQARIFVNGSPRLTGTVSGATVRFNGVALDNRGASPNTLSVEVTNADGVACTQDFPVPVFVDCDGASCGITLPNTTSAFLNQNDDVSDAPGFQTDFEVTTSADGAGRPIRLIIDGNETDALTQTAAMVGSGGVASFGNVELSEGVHRAQAECMDDAGNLSRSGVVEWTVDITPCALTLTDPAAGTIFVDADDLDDSIDGVQINAAGTAAADCDSLRVGLCASIDSVAYGAATSDWNATVTLGSSRNQNICAQAQDAAGNTTTAMVGVVLNTAAPQLNIVTPAAGAAFNRLGTAGRTADLNPATGTCEAAFIVDCTEVGVEVTLLRNDTMTQLGGGSATCEAVAGLPAPYLGQASFASVSLPALEDGTALSVVARQENERLVGVSDPLAVLSDCVAPVLALNEPMCGAILRSSDDMNPGAPGVQRRVRFQNPSLPKPPVELELLDQAGASIYGPVTSTSPSTGLLTDFLDVSFGGSGVVTIVGRASDMAGNVGSVSCDVTVSDLPNLSITAPSASSVLSGANDCDPTAPGLQIAVRASTDAAATDASIQIGSAAPVTVALSDLTDADGACVDAIQGRSLPVTVTVSGDPRGSVMASVVVNIDSLPPTVAISDFAPQDPPADRRGGIVRFTWTAVEDQGGGSLESYAVRCGPTAITDEAGWAAASPRMISVTPGTPTSAQSAEIAGFRVGVESFCVLRGRDIAGALTPIPAASPSVELDFLTVEWSSVADNGRAAAAVGDVNGDGIDDVLIGANQRAALYFGSAVLGGLPTAPDVTFLPPAGTISFGDVVAGLGDFNGDGFDDFAVSDRNGNGLMGAVYVFFGRPSTAPWPATIDLSAGCPGLCLNGTATNGRLGWEIDSAGDFDGDGFADLAIGAPVAGKVYVVRGAAVTGTFELPGSDPAATVDAFEVEAPTGTRNFGNSVTSPGDLSADGRSELIVAAPGGGPMGFAGQVLRVDGRAFPAGMAGLVSIPAAEVTSLASGGAGTFGTGVRSIGDFDGDGFIDIAVYESSSAGRVIVLLARAGTHSLADSVAFTNDVPSAGSDLFGTAIALGAHPILGRLGDIDADGRTELLVGSAQRGTAAGTGDLFYGATPAVARARSSADVILDPAPATTSGARRVQFIGDINDDGYADLALGDFTGEGRVIIYY